MSFETLNYISDGKGEKFAFVQIFGQQFGQKVTSGFNEAEFIQRVKKDLAIDFVKELGGEIAWHSPKQH